MKQLALVMLCLSSSLSAQSTAKPEFSADAFKSHVAFLADDLLQGRQPGTAGHEIAMRYVVSQFIAAGLKPAGDNGS